MKKLFATVLSLVLVISAFAHNTGAIDEKVKQSFNAAFPNAQQVNWQESAYTYQVYFVEANIPARIFYAKDNSFVVIMRYYKEERLPFHARYLIQKKYEGKKVFGVTEVTTVSDAGSSTVSYRVVLEDEKKWYVVQVDNDGGITPVQKFWK